MERDDPPLKRRHQRDARTTLTTRTPSPADSADQGFIARRWSGSSVGRWAVIGIGALLISAPLAGCNGSARSAPETSAPKQETQPRGALPEPKDYAQTCRLVASWCTAVSGNIPPALRRPLHVSHLSSTASCPTTPGQTFRNDQFGGTALGPGPVRPLVSPEGGDPRTGVVPFTRWPSDRSWWYVKTLWFSPPSYKGPVLIRGRQLDGREHVVFGEGPTLVDPRLPPGPTVNGTGGWRQWPGGTFIRRLGCYAWQVDGVGFSHVVVFEATRATG